MKKNRPFKFHGHDLCNFIINSADETSIEVQLAQPRLVRKGPEPLSSKHAAMRVKNPQKVMILGLHELEWFWKDSCCGGFHELGTIHSSPPSPRSTLSSQMVSE